MQIFQVQPWPKGVGNSEVSDYVKVEATDELDAAERLLKMPLQLNDRHDMYIRAFVRRLGGRPHGAPTKVFAADITPMAWAKRRFAFADYGAYFDLFEKLVMANPLLHRQFIMVSVDVWGDKPGVGEYYVGVPSEAFLAGFDGFERVVESDLPKVIDTLHIADATTADFRSRFRFKTDDERKQSFRRSPSRK
jgi:hypothetical protein